MQASVADLAHLLNTAPALHALHHSERPWPQTNCSVDLLIELVAAYGLEPRWMLAFTVIQDFEGDHFSFFKVPSEDLEELYGLAIQELAVWDDLQAHVLQQLQLNRVVLVEVDGYYLPDTRGVTYREQHGKTTIGIYALDPQARQMAYFHNETRGVLSGEDFDGTLQKLGAQHNLLMPYCEVVKRLRAATAQPAQVALAQLRKHLQRRPARNPFAAYAQALPQHLEQLKARGPEYFHAYAFNTVRQAGANFGLMDDFLRALPHPAFATAADHARKIAEDAKALQFRMARAASRGKLDGLDSAVQDLAQTYDHLMAALDHALNHAAKA